MCREDFNHVWIFVCLLERGTKDLGAKVEVCVGHFDADVAGCGCRVWATGERAEEMRDA